MSPFQQKQQQEIIYTRTNNIDSYPCTHTYKLIHTTAFIPFYKNYNKTPTKTTKSKGIKECKRKESVTEYLLILTNVTTTTKCMYICNLVACCKFRKYCKECITYRKLYVIYI